MKYNPKTREVTLTTNRCFSCKGSGEEQEMVRVNCESCHGTGNGPRGGRGSCRSCYGSGWGRMRETGEIVACRYCKGRGEVDDNQTTRIPIGIWKKMNLPFVVSRSDRRGSFNEENLGFNCLYSSVDYGAASRMSDGLLIAKVKLNIDLGVQLCSVWTAEKGLCDRIVIAVHRNGYSVRPQWGDENVVPVAEGVGQTTFERAREVF